MTRWNVEADANEESAGGSGGGFEPAPRGFYTIQVANYKDGMTQGNDRNPPRPMVVLECEIAEGEYLGKKVWLTVVQIPKGAKGHGLMVHYLHAFGLEYDGKLDFDTSEFQGRQAAALLGTKPFTKLKDGRTYTNEVNWVEAVYTDNHAQPAELPPAPEPKKTAAPVAGKSAPAAQHDLEEVPF